MKKTPLKAKTGLKSRPKPKRHPKPKLTPLRKKADKLVAHATRLRDSEFVDGAWQGQCITCNRTMLVCYKDNKGVWRYTKTNGWGHFIGRSNMYLRYDPENVNLQCSHCNAWLDKNSMIGLYRTALDNKYGSGTWKKLEQLGKDKESFRLSVGFLTEVINDAQAEIDFYLKK